MSEEARRTVVATLIDLAGSPDYRDRADTGRSLASFAEVPKAGKALLDLVLDTGDTSVTHETATALLRRQDTVGLAVVASALAVADPPTTPTGFTPRCSTWSRCSPAIAMPLSGTARCSPEVPMSRSAAADAG